MLVTDVTSGMLDTKCPAVRQFEMLMTVFAICQSHHFSQIVGYSDVDDFMIVSLIILVTEFVNNIFKLSPTQKVSNIRHQHRCSLIAVQIKIHEIDLIYSKCPRNSEIRSILAQSEIGFTKLINVGLFDFSCKVKCQKDLLNIFNFRQHPSDKFHYVIQILIIQKSPT